MAGTPSLGPGLKKGSRAGLGLVVAAAGRTGQTRIEQSAPSSRTRSQQAKHGAATTTNRVQTNAAASDLVTAVPLEEVEAKCEGDILVTILVPYEEELFCGQQLKARYAVFCQSRERDRPDKQW